MNADLALANTGVWLAAHGLLVAGAGLALLAWSLWLFSPRRDQALAIAKLKVQLATADRTAAQERQNAVEATWLAQQAQEYATDKARELTYVNDQLQCALLELGTDWEVQP